MRPLLKIILPIVILVGALGTFAVLKATKPMVENVPVVERSWTVATVPATGQSVTPEIRVYGEIVSGRDAELRPLVAGRIVEVGDNVVEGGVVRAGDLLIAIDPFDYETDVADRRSKLAEAEARLAELESDLTGERAMLGEDRRQLKLNRDEAARREKLLKTGAGTQKSLDDARLSLIAGEQRVTSRSQSLKTKAARVAQAGASVEQARVALSRAERDLANTRLIAPHDGYLQDVNAAVGKQVSSNDRVASLIDADRLEARFVVSDRQYARVLASGGYQGRPAQVDWKLGGETVSFAAMVERTEGAIDASSGGVRLIATLGKMPADASIRPGAFIEVSLDDRTHDNVIAVPGSALHDTADKGRQVYVIAEGRLQPVPVTVVARHDTDWLIQGAFAPDAAIVTTRFPQMGPGVRVDAVKSSDGEGR
ncbi:efflux RND transporter periplasmic adaptor subunit [Magnetospira sp. QH-2]|uniref:efflux RND transporter periplasmic adaptor subunit n=1 Tax=Magnetospira sp. (strain QH-2) TaxID=1288970 RepID=UPI0003E81308|nr:efflux RND transporter periplasmic adaptor subunit [Magnetospira sp. QH-2]CCQ74872.1 putative Efflux transporter, RND family, MFP subunit [Magnetospira sp. QH-2]